MSKGPLGRRPESLVLNLISSAARLRGFEEDLGLTGNQFASTLSILYVGHITMQVPSCESYMCYGPALLLTFLPRLNRNLLLNHLGKPSIYLPGCMALWGLVSVLIGVTHNCTGVMLTRFFLGIFESAFFPVSCH